MNPDLLLVIALAPLVAGVIAGLGGRVIGRAGAHSITIAAVALSFVLSLRVLWRLEVDHVAVYEGTVYTWLVAGGLHIQVGFLVDQLTALMMATVTFVSLCVHVYTIGYMSDDPGYQRFFAYIALFTFAMLMLVMSNNFMQLFFGWEGVGVISYLLIGFWYTRPSAVFANLKAFLVNRVGDFGFILGIAAILYYTHSLDYRAVFAAAPHIAAEHLPITATHTVPAMALICVCLFVGAMGKSAQVPLHVWLPDSMEGPTPISALIHAATMVTAGIFMVARMSPLFEYSSGALSFVLVIGATSAFFMGLLGVVATDIKRVIAYSTLSQLGYMTAALGVSDYSGAIFHLMTHAFFKALLFLGAGSVIIAMHHEQDMRKMGGLGKYMPWTTGTFWVGALALCGVPFFSGGYSKDAIIEAVHASHRWGATYGYWCVLLGAFVTALYTFRMIFLTFYGKERFRAEATHGGHGGEAHDREEEGHGTPRESPLVVVVPLVALAIPALAVGAVTARTLLFGHFFGGSIFVLPANDVLREVARDIHGSVWLGFALHGFVSAPFWVAVAGFLTAWACYMWKPQLADVAAERLGPLYRLLTQKFYFDWFNEHVVAPATRMIGVGLWRGGDQALIDGALVNGSAGAVRRIGSVLRIVQSGYLYSYAFWMIIGLVVLIGWFLVRI